MSTNKQYALNFCFQQQKCHFPIQGKADLFVQHPPDTSQSALHWAQKYNLNI